MLEGPPVGPCKWINWLFSKIQIGLKHSLIVKLDQLRSRTNNKNQLESLLYPANEISTFQWININGNTVDF